MTVLTGDAVSEAQQNQIPPVFRRLASEYFDGVRGFERYNRETIHAGVKFRCDRGELYGFIRALRNHFDKVRPANVAHREDSVMVQVRFR